MKSIPFLIVSLALVSCASNEGDVRRALEKDPQIVFDVIEKHPEQFMEVVNRAAQVAQRQQMEQQAAKMKADQEQDIKNPRQPELSDERRLQGTAQSPIRIVEYADFQCPACRIAYVNLKTFKDKYKGQIQFFYKNMPLDFHKMAYPSALYFEAVRLQDKAMAMRFYDYLFENQRELSMEFLKKTAKLVGADLARLEKDIKSDKVKKIISADEAEFEKFGFTGTPVLIVNGVALHGAQPAEELERIVQATRQRY